MDEQRFKAYMALIEQLLICPQGQEMELLQARAELVDAELLVVMEQVADYLDSQGNSNANWLRGLASQLAQVLKRDMGSKRAGEAETRDSVKFLIETLQLIQDSQGNPKQVYPVWAQQQARLNSALLEVFPQVVAMLHEQHAERQLSIAFVLVIFGDLIQQFPSGIRWLNLELSIAAHEQALRIYTYEAFPEQWAMTQNGLARAYCARIRGERADNLEQAIAAFEQALRIHTYEAFPERWAMTQHNLASAYMERIRGERADNLERAIAAFEQALKVHTHKAYPEHWAMTQNNLANAYSKRIRGERADNLEQAIAAFEQALKVRTREAYPEHWATTQNNLASAYSERIRGERADNLEQAIAAFEQALKVRTREAYPEHWAETQNNLAVAYWNRIRGERADNPERAIAAFEQALKVYTHEAFPADWAMTQNNLAIAYWNRIRGKRADNLEQAIAAFEQALKVYTHEAFPKHWAMTQNNLASTYSERIRGERADNLEQAIAAFEQALKVHTHKAYPEHWAMTQNNLASAYSNRIRGERAENVEQAIAAYEQALQVFTHKAFPVDCRRTARNLGNLHFEQQAWSKASNAYTTALSASEALYQACIFLGGKAAELAETADLPRRTAYALARSGNLQKAVEVLEQGRARGLSETLERDRANLTQLQQTEPHLYEQYQDITHQLRNLESQERDRMVSSDRHNLTPETHRNLATHLRQSLNAVITEIRQVEGYADFLGQPNFEDIRVALQPSRPLVYLVSTPAGSLALIVTLDGIDALWLDDLTETSLQELLQNWFSAYSQSQTDRQAWFNAIDQGTRQLWQPLMEPLIRHLKTHNFHQATLIPTGYLSLLPLHAAWTEDPDAPTGRHYALDDIHFTYVPNAKSLSAAQNIATRTQADSILAIDNPRNDLPNSEREVQAAISHFPQHRVLKHEEAQTETVRSYLSEASIVHFACHGTANLNEPLNSGLLMNDGLLTLRDILALNLSDRGGIRLAILSACETGLSGIENADEAISLPTGLLQAGVAGVIASLWSVSDLSTMLLLTKFYDLWRDQHLPTDQSLRQAQRWLRDTTNEEKIAEFKTFLPTFAGTRMSSTTAQQLYDELAWEDENERSFAHPFHWAAFSYTGI